MICPTCHGERMVREDYLILPYSTHGVIMAVVPCPDCGGCGRVHCCEGIARAAGRQVITGAGMRKGKFNVAWIDGHREPQCPPDPRYPNGVDIAPEKIDAACCKAMLPYPAKRCGFYRVNCLICGVDALITTAGRRDDPRSVVLRCKIASTAQ